MNGFKSLRAAKFSRNVLASIAILGTASGIAGLGTFASFTSTTSASHTASTGTVVLNIGTTNTIANRFNVASPLLAPGSTYSRPFDLTNAGTLNMTAIAMTTTAPTSSLLDTDITNGLQLTISSCPSPWTEAGSGATATYTCSGGVTSVVASKPIIGANTPLPALAALTAGSTDRLLATITLPATANDTFQAKTSTFTFSFVGTR